MITRADLGKVNRTQPSVGRVVHYHMPGLGQPVAAVVVALHDARRGDIEIAPLHPAVVALQGPAYKRVPFGGPDRPDTWSWPPHVPAEEMDP